MIDEKTEKYRQQIQAFLGDEKLESIELNNEGLVNDVFIVNGRRVFRFPKYDWAYEDMRHEALCLALAGRYVSLPLPQWTLQDDAFVTYPLITGEPLQRHTILQLAEVDQEKLASQIGVFLRQLHAIPPAEARQQGIQPSVTNKTPQNWLDFYATIQEKLFPYLMNFQKEWLRYLFAPVVNDPDFMAYETCFINGDLATYHLLYDAESHRLNGIIDFGTAGLGDPATDFAMLINQYGESFVRRLDRYYPHLDALINRARFRAAAVELEWALGGLNHPEDPSWFFVHLGRARDMDLLSKGL